MHVWSSLVVVWSPEAWAVLRRAVQEEERCPRGGVVHAEEGSSGGGVQRRGLAGVQRRGLEGVQRRGGGPGEGGGPEGGEGSSGG